jgi:hypothetical protein
MREKQILRRWLRMTPERIVPLTVILSGAKDLLFRVSSRISVIGDQKETS